MKNYKYKFFIFIASLIIGFLGSINFNINSMSSLFKMNAKNIRMLQKKEICYMKV